MADRANERPRNKSPPFKVVIVEVGMKMSRARSLVLPYALLVLGPAIHAATIEGLWVVEDGKAHVRIEPCGRDLCGTIVWLEEPTDENGKTRRDVNNPDPQLRARPIQGLGILERFATVPNDKRVWNGGTIYDPENGKTYRCTLRLDGGDRLIIRGFVGIRLFGRTTYWSRIG